MEWIGLSSFNIDPAEKLLIFSIVKIVDLFSIFFIMAHWLEEEAFGYDIND